MTTDWKAARARCCDQTRFPSSHYYLGAGVVWVLRSDDYEDRAALPADVFDRLTGGDLFDLDDLPSWFLGMRVYDTAVEAYEALERAGG